MTLFTVWISQSVVRVIKNNSKNILTLLLSMLSFSLSLSLFFISQVYIMHGLYVCVMYVVYRQQVIHKLFYSLDCKDFVQTNFSIKIKFALVKWFMDYFQ